MGEEKESVKSEANMAAHVYMAWRLLVKGIHDFNFDERIGCSMDDPRAIAQFIQREIIRDGRPLRIIDEAIAHTVAIFHAEDWPAMTLEEVAAEIERRGGVRKLFPTHIPSMFEMAPVIIEVLDTTKPRTEEEALAEIERRGGPEQIYFDEMRRRSIIVDGAVIDGGHRAKRI